MIDNVVLQNTFGVLVLRFSEPLDAVSARSASLYHLVEAGTDGNFDTGDDVPVEIQTVNYTTGDLEVSLVFNSALPQGRYRLTLGSPTEALVDQAGNALDGDNNGTPGGNFIRRFRINLAPAVLSTTINDGSIQRSRVNTYTVQFSENVGASLSEDDFLLHNLTTNTDVDPIDTTLTYDAVTNRATIEFTGFPGDKLADGNYRLTINAASVVDADGKPMAANYTFTFHVLTGDANGDRVTNDLDLYRVWQNLLKLPAARSLNEDLSGDGQVNFVDVNIVRGNYLATLPAPGPASLDPGLLSIAVAASATQSAPAPTPVSTANAAIPVAGEAAVATPDAHGQSTVAPFLVPLRPQLAALPVTAWRADLRLTDHEHLAPDDGTPSSADADSGAVHDRRLARWSVGHRITKFLKLADKKWSML